MTHFADSLKTLNPTVRVACTAAAAVCAAAVNAGLLELFDSASSERWLSPTQQVLQAQAQCDDLPERSARTRCAQNLVARTLARAERPEQVAAR